MFLVLVVLLAAPFVELAVMVQVARWIGTLEMIGLLLVVSAAGVLVVRWQGVGAWERIRADLQGGRVPGAALTDGALILLAGVLLVVPGFVSDALGLLLLVPPVRHLARVIVRRRFLPSPGAVDETIDARSRVRGRPELDDPGDPTAAP